MANLTKRTLITRMKQIEEDLDKYSQRVDADLLVLGGNQRRIEEEVEANLSKYKKFCLKLRAEVTSSMAADDYLRNLVSDSEPRASRDQRKRGHVVDSRLGKRPLGN